MPKTNVTSSRPWHLYVGQVIAWQLTKTTSIDECKELLCVLRNRQLSHGTAIEEVYTDNCCTIKAKLHSIFGPNVHAYVDIFHAAQKKTKTITKRHPLCKLVMKDMQMLFRDPRDRGHQRNSPIPSIDVLLKNLDFFCTKWGEAEVNGWKIFSNKTIHELESLWVHITRGCLSGINPGCGTNCNENLHRSINPFFSRFRIGIPLAIALLTVLFHRHNQ